MRKTAVEWLIEQMRKRKEQGLSLSFYDLELFAEQAKEIEKYQIMDANRDGLDMVLEKKIFLTAEQYYNETYNK